MLLKDLLTGSSILISGSKRIALSNLFDGIDVERVRYTVKQANTLQCGIFLPNGIQYVQAYFLITSLDRVIVPIPILAKSREIISTINYCEIHVIFTNSVHEPFLMEALGVYEEKVFVYNLDDNSIKNNGGATSTIEIDQGNGTEDDTAIILHTSGTTSNPKRVMLSHKNLISNIESNIRSLKLNKDDKTLIILPMFFGYCNTAQFLTHLYLGASIVIMERIFLANKFFELVEKEKITNCTCVPSMLMMLLNFKNNHNYNTKSLRYICFGGGYMPVPKLKKIIKLFPHTGIVQTYGQTEASPRITALLPDDALIKIGSVGKPIPGVNVRIVDDKGLDVEDYKVGEIIAKGDNIMKGYYNRSEITKQTVRNGWLYTGDLAYYDNEKYIYLVGRKKNIIISGGINIYPEEIEEVLLTHPEVKEAYVYSVKDAVLGELPVAKVVLHDAAAKDSISAKALISYCIKNLANYKVPGEIFIVSQIRKTRTGKIKRIKEKKLNAE